MSRRKTPADYHALAERRGFLWLGPKVPNNKTKTTWECSRGHRWEARYSSIQQGHGCHICKTERAASLCRNLPAEYHKLAIESGIRWLGPEVPNASTPTEWECRLGHRWWTPYKIIQQGHGCPVCANISRSAQQRYGPAEYHELAIESGIRWLGPEVSNTRTPTEWECRLGHRWDACFDTIRRGSSCPFCAGNAQKTYDDYYQLAKERGFRWLGSEVPNVNTPTEWECSLGHRWWTPYKTILQGHGCPTCAGWISGAFASSLQRTLCDMLSGQLNYPFDNLRIDVALPADKIAIEYDAWYWHGYRLEQDDLRDQELLSAGWQILHIRSNSSLPTQPELHAAISRLTSTNDRVVEIVLDDWGHGPTIADVRNRDS